jgi:hypothetical protein
MCSGIELRSAADRSERLGTPISVGVSSKGSLAVALVAEDVELNLAGITPGMEAAGFHEIFPESVWVGPP